MVSCRERMVLVNSCEISVVSLAMIREGEALNRRQEKT